MEEEKKEENNKVSLKRIIPEDFISKPYAVPNSSIPPNILEFEYSFCYDSKRLYNLCMLTTEVLVYASGNYLHFLNIKTQEMTFRRSVMGGGIGAISINPNTKNNYLTVAENGIDPPVFLYKFPGLKIVTILRGGAERCYTRVAYSKDGELLATQAGEPDYMLTIWKWRLKSILLQAESFQNDVLNVMFSPYNPKQIISCGLGHIKFWKINQTFTGLKLQGELGRFGKTDICDIYAIYPLPDEKVISGCEWGNMLLWEQGLIKLEVCRKSRRPCHTAPITIISRNGGEVMTVGMDGYVRIWFWETVDIADPDEDDPFVEIEPIYEFKLNTQDHKCEIRNLIKRDPNNSHDFKYYVQDGTGGIWLCDLNTEAVPQNPQHLFKCHAGAVVAVKACPFSTYITSLGKGGSLHLYNYKTREIKLKKNYSASGSDLIWLPLHADPTGSVVIMGFDDGVVRVVLIEVESKNVGVQRVHLIQSIKPNSSGITKLSINPEATILASGGTDHKIFILQFDYSGEFPILIPIGYLMTDSPPTALNWKMDERATIIAGCTFGEVYEASLPEIPQSYTTESYSLDLVKVKTFKFRSVKSEIRRQIKIEEIKIRKKKKRDEKIKKMKEANKDLHVDEMDIEDSEDEEELEPLFYPKVPNRILWLQYTPSKTIWLSMAGYDAGYIYECICNGRQKNKTVKNTIIADGDDIEIHSYLYHHNYLIFGIQSGIIRVNVIKADFHDISDYWEYSMHDNFKGDITTLISSYDHRYIFSAGEDGNIFLYKWNGSVPPTPTIHVKSYKIPEDAIDIVDKKALSIEQQRLKDVQDLAFKNATERKTAVLKLLTNYSIQFQELLERNNALPQSQQFSENAFELDQRVTHDFFKSFYAEFELTKRKMAFDIEKATLSRERVMEFYIDPLENLSIEVSAIRSPTKITSFRIQKLDEEFYRTKIEIEERILLEADKRRVIQPVEEVKHELPPIILSQESFLEGISPSTIDLRLGPKMRRLLDKYRHRKYREKERARERTTVAAQKPDPNKNHIDDVIAIEYAKQTIGDYKLKTDPLYESDVTEHTLYKFRTILAVREEIFNKQNEYNKKVFELRKQKKDFYKHVEDKKHEMKIIYRFIPKDQWRAIPTLPVIDKEKEYPEENVVPRVDIKLLDQIDIQSQADEETFDVDSDIPRMDPFKVCPPIEKYQKLTELRKYLIPKIITKEDLTPWEEELKSISAINKVSEQNQIIEEIETFIQNYDEKLIKIAETRLQIENDVKFLEAFLITINQELWIMKHFEHREDTLLEKILINLNKINELQSSILRLNTDIDDTKKQIEKNQEEQKSIRDEFLNLIKEDQFVDFLKRIFKRKYKPPKKEGSDDSSEESTDLSETSSEEEQDQGSIASSKIALLDEDHCPPGCNQATYDMTFELRGQRHILEHEHYDKLKYIESIQAKIKDVNLSIKGLQSEAQLFKTELQELRREKQTYLNKVGTLVVLRMDQLQYFKKMEDINDLESALLYNLQNISKLQTRVGELRLETLETKRKHKINIIHLTRMKTDCNFMESKIAALVPQINEAMIQKFGRIVNLDELEESVLRRFIFNLKISLADEKAEAEHTIAEKKRSLAVYERKLIEETQKSTEKLNILTVLLEEKTFLSGIVKEQPLLNMRIACAVEGKSCSDLEKLKEIDKRQREQIECLEKEIRGLRLRTKTYIAPNEEEPDQSKCMYVLPPKDEYADSLFSTFQDTPKKKDIFKEVSSLILLFFTEKFADTTRIADIQKYAEKTSKQFIYIANNIHPGNREKEIQSAKRYIKLLLPDNCFTCLTSDDLNTLIDDVIDIVQDGKNPIDTNDILCGIVLNAKEAAKHLKKMKFTQKVITEVITQMAEVMGPEEFKNLNNVEAIVKYLNDLPEISMVTVDAFASLDDTILQCQASNEEVNQDTVKGFLTSLMNSLVENISQHSND